MRSEDLTIFADVGYFAPIQSLPQDRWFAPIVGAGQGGISW